MRKLGQDPGLLAAVASGILSAAAFAPISAWPLILVAPVPLLWALDRQRDAGWRRTFLLGWMAAGVHFMATLHWILALPSDEVTIPGLMIPALLFLAAYLALYFGVAAAVAATISRRLRLSIALVWPVTATLADALRAQGELAFPWSSGAYALVRATPVLQFSALSGFYGLVLWVSLVPAVLYFALRAVGRLRVAAWIVWVVVLVAPWAYGASVLRHADGHETDGPSGVSIAVIQPNTSRTIKWDPRYREIVVSDLLTRTRRAAVEKPDLIIWPETAVPMVLLAEPAPIRPGAIDGRLVGRHAPVRHAPPRTRPRTLCSAQLGGSA